MIAIGIIVIDIQNNNGKRTRDIVEYNQQANADKACKK